MKKTEIIAAVAEKTGHSKKIAEQIIDAAFDTIAGAVAKGDKVQLLGFGSFEARERAGRVGRNPKTLEEIQIPATRVPAFKAGKALKEAVAS